MGIRRVLICEYLFGVVLSYVARDVRCVLTRVDGDMYVPLLTP
jgi:hypothetical protein